METDNYEIIKLSKNETTVFTIYNLNLNLLYYVFRS